MPQPKRHHLDRPARPPQRTPARVAAAMGAALVLGLGLYLWIGRNDPVPPWIALPTNSKLVESRNAPADQPQGMMVRYYLRIELPVEPGPALTQVSAGVSAAQWDSPRPATKDDLFPRGGWPQWVQDHIYHVPEAASGQLMTSKQAGEVLHLYAWSRSGGGAIVELVQEGMGGTGVAPLEGQ